jgi:hypothetical protein
MKTLSLVLLLIASMAFIMMGCSDNSSPVVSSKNQAINTASSNMSLAKGGVQHSLTGSANTYNILASVPGFGNCIIPGPKEKGGFYNVFTVNAIDQGNGTVSGRFVSQFQGKIPPGWESGSCEKVEGRVIQLVVDETGTKAKVVCEVTTWTVAPNNPAPRWFVIAFVDMGEGGKSAPDRESSWWGSSDPADLALWLGQTPQEYIDWEWSILKDIFPDMGATIPIDHGNIQVR